MDGSSLDKAVVMARGLGTRMQRPAADARLDPHQTAAADAGLKAMIPIDRPFLDYVLSALADAGIRQVCLVIGPEHPTIRQYYADQVPLERLRIDFAVQPVADGTAHAVAAAANFVGTDDFLVLNADNYYPARAVRPLVAPPSERGVCVERNSFRSSCSPALPSQGGMGSGFAVALFPREALLRQSNIPAERIARYAIANQDAAGMLAEIVEKPDADTLARFPQPWLVSMNLWRFGPMIFEACRAITRSSRGEFELVDAVRYAMTRLGTQFRVSCVAAPVLDLTCRDDIGPVAARLAGTQVQL